MTSLRIATIATALLLATGTTLATDDTTRDKELAAAKAALDLAAKRYAELATGHAESARGRALIARTQAEGARRQAIQQKGLRKRPLIGVVLAADAQAGVDIRGITPDGPAAKAGLRSGDRLVTVDGKEILGSSDELRLENARTLLAGLEAGKPVKLGYVREGRHASIDVVPQLDQRIAIFSNGALVRPDGSIFIERLADGTLHVQADSITTDKVFNLAPEVRRQISRVAEGDATHLLSAFRWNGLNLASLDADLGRYFGTDSGVLVLSSGNLEGLRAGDVIQRVDGKPVTTPREVMEVLRDKREGDTASVDYLRDRRTGKAQVTTPELMAWPSAPPAPPAPPRPPSPNPPAAPSAPPVPPKAMAVPPESLTPAVVAFENGETMRTRAYADADVIR